MKIFQYVFFFALLIGIASLTTGCWTDVDAYSEFVCERFGGDADNDGFCSRQDCDDFNPTVFPGSTCDDGDSTTVDDVLTVNCECVGE